MSQMDRGNVNFNFLVDFVFVFFNTELKFGISVRRLLSQHIMVGEEFQLIMFDLIQIKKK